jgi:HEAT repeat protein
LLYFFVYGYIQNNSAIRYWAATGLLMLKDDAKPAIPQLKKALDDPSHSVATVAAEAIYHLGEKEIAIDAILTAFDHPEDCVRNFALNALEFTGDNSPKAQKAVLELEEKLKNDNSLRFDKWTVM